MRLAFAETLFDTDAEAMAMLAEMLARPACYAARALLLSSARRPPGWRPRAQMFALPADGERAIDVQSTVLATCERGPAQKEQ